MTTERITLKGNANTDFWPLAQAFAAAAALSGGAVVIKCDESQDVSTNLKAWQNRWNANQTGWHLKEVNPVFERYLRVITPPDRSAEGGLPPRFLFPLCGKSADMAYLARKGYAAVGIEGIGKAIQEFAQEHGVTGRTVRIALPPEVDAKQFQMHAVLIGWDVEPATPKPAQPVLIVEGDFLAIGATEAKALVPFAAAFDRGSLVAIDPSMRLRYAQSLSSLIAEGGKVLLVTVEHDAFADGRLGPPFEVTEVEVQALFGASFSVKLLHREDRLDIDAGMKARGCSRFHECAYLLEKRGGDVP